MNWRVACFQSYGALTLVWFGRMVIGEVIQRQVYDEKPSTKRVDASSIQLALCLDFAVPESGTLFIRGPILAVLGYQTRS